VRIFREFREFAVKGNVVDLAVGVIIGASFGRIVSSLVEDVIMPPISLAIGRVNFSNLYLVFPGQAENLAKVEGAPTLETLRKAGVAVFAYGNFINQILQFLIVAFAVFMLVKVINRAKSTIEPPPAPGEPVTRQCPHCISDIPYKATRCKFCTSDVAEAATS
jgi:large conductance mechanosensitive channel